MKYYDKIDIRPAMHTTTGSPLPKMFQQLSAVAVGSLSGELVDRVWTRVLPLSRHRVVPSILQQMESDLGVWRVDGPD